MRWKSKRKKIEDIKLVVNGAGAAAVSCTNLYIRLGVRRENIVMCDSRGVINRKRTNLTPQKAQFVTDRDIDTLEEAMAGADVFLGLSVKDVITPEMIRSMAERPIVFALANPDPEIEYSKAIASRPDLIFATGRSDYPNQINNVLGFPYIFRGALDSGATAINEEMKLAAVRAIAGLAKLPVPSVVNAAYNMSGVGFGPEYILPKPLDPRLLTTVAPAVAKAAMESGVARKEITDWEQYNQRLNSLMGYDTKLMRRFTELAKIEPATRCFRRRKYRQHVACGCGSPQRRRMRTDIAWQCRDDSQACSKKLGVELDGMAVVNPRHDCETERRLSYAKKSFQRKGARGFTLREALEKMYDRNYFGMMMVETGDADVFIAGTYSNHSEVVSVARNVVGIRPGYSHFAAMHIMNTKRGVYFLADTMINETEDCGTLVDVARLARGAVEYFAKEPVSNDFL